MDNNGELPRIMVPIIIVWALALNGWGLWCTYIAFAGGKLPLLPVVLPGGIGSGLLFLLIGEPILMGLGNFVGEWVLCPLLVLAMAVCGRLPSTDRTAPKAVLH